jgi:prophage antirepressor-like protein
MSTQTHLADFNGYPIEIIHYHDQPWLTAEQIGKALGLQHARKGILKIFDRHRAEISKAGVTVVNLGTVQGNRDMTVFSPRAARTIAFFCQTEMAQRFRCWVLDELEKVEQLTGLDIPTHIRRELLNARPLWGKIAEYKQKGLNHVEIGKLLDVSDTTIRNHVRRMEKCGLLQAPVQLLQQQQHARKLLHHAEG